MVKEAAPLDGKGVGNTRPGPDLHLLPHQFLVGIVSQGVWAQQCQLLVVKFRGPVVAKHGAQVCTNLGFPVYELEAGGLPRLRT